MTKLSVAHDFECANAQSVTRRGPASFLVVTRPDEALNGGVYANSSYYGAIRLHNPGTIPIQATVTFREGGDIGSWRTVAQRVRQPGQRAPLLAWQPIPEVEIEQDAANHDYTVHPLVPPGAELDLSSMYWYAASEIAADLAALAARHPELTVTSIATTAEGRAVPLASLGPANAPTLILSATPQCHEVGSITVMGLLQAALSGELRDLVGPCRLVFLPLTNPDGNAHGCCMANARQQNLVFGFGGPASPPESVECAAIWRAVTELHPAALLEWHSYPHLNRPSFRAYEMVSALYPPAAQARGAAFATLLRGVAPNGPVVVAPGSQIASQFAPSMIARLVTEHGIPATLYKLHNRETIPSNLAHARLVTRAVVQWLVA
jgi:hypothetical protein